MIPLPARKKIIPPPRRSMSSFLNTDKSATGKTLDALAASRTKYAQLLAEFGEDGVPTSVLMHKKHIKALDIMATERSYTSTMHNGGKGAFKTSGCGCTAGALSRFPQNIGRALLLLYTKKGDTVCDPFAGHNSRMEFCWRAGRNYIGQDLSHEFMDANRAIREILLNEKDQDLFGAICHSQASITLHEGDSRFLQMESNSGDFTITSPPYWDIEYYGDEPEQLGQNSYEGFLEGLYQVQAENFRVLKSGAFCVWCINDFRRKGVFYSYHEHCAEGLRRAGFTQWDIAITDFGSSIRQNFPNQVIEQKILPKRHEYNLVFRKP